MTKKVKAHVKIDTGFGRYGFIYTDETGILEACKSNENIEIKRCVYSFFKAYRFQVDFISI